MCPETRTTPTRCSAIALRAAGTRCRGAALVAALAVMAVTVGCSSRVPEVGTPEWCRHMSQQPQSQWSMDDAFAFASHCFGG